MSVSFVNGYYCESGCDVAKAKRGIDPHPKRGLAELVEARVEEARRSRLEEPAVVFGGTLSSLNATQGTGPEAVTPAVASDAPPPTPAATVNLLV